MPGYNPQEKNTLQVRKRQSRQPFLMAGLIEMLSPRFSLNDCFVTLTFNEDVQFHEVKHGEKLNRFYHKLNRAVFGKLYDRGIKKLNSVSVAEYNTSQGLHVHMLLERPAANERFDGDFEELVINTWVATNYGVVKSAQDVRPVHALEGGVEYMAKQINRADDMLRVDFSHLH